MRRANAWCRWFLILASTGMMFGTLESCMADLMRDVAGELDQTAWELDGEPQTVGQWWENLWNGQGNGSSEDADDFDDWWEDLWD